MIKTRIVGAAAASVFGLAAVAGTALTIAAPAYAAPGKTSTSGTTQPIGHEHHVGQDLRASSAPTGWTTGSQQRAASDEVSRSIAQLFGTHDQQYQTLAQQAAAFHDQFVECLTICN